VRGVVASLEVLFASWRVLLAAESASRFTEVSRGRAMPWKCPACQLHITHVDSEPKPGQVYRCHICRLELVLDPSTGKLVLAPFPGERHERRSA